MLGIEERQNCPYSKPDNSDTNLLLAAAPAQIMTHLLISTVRRNVVTQYATLGEPLEFLKKIKIEKKTEVVWNEIDLNSWEGKRLMGFKIHQMATNFGVMKPHVE